MDLLSINKAGTVAPRPYKAMKKGRSLGRYCVSRYVVNEFN